MFNKFNYFHKEQTRKFKEDIFRRENHDHNPEQDCFHCPMGQKIQKASEGKRKKSTGFEQQVSFYQAQNCRECQLRWGCHKAIGERVIVINHNLERHKQKARDLFLSPEGIEYRKRLPQMQKQHLETSNRTKVLEDFCSGAKKKCRLRPNYLPLHTFYRKSGLKNPVFLFF